MIGEPGGVVKQTSVPGRRGEQQMPLVVYSKVLKPTVQQTDSTVKKRADNTRFCAKFDIFII